MVKRGKFLLFLAFLMLLVSCEKEFDKYYEVNESGGTIVEVLKGKEDYSMFNEALETAGVREGGSFTSFSSVLGSSGLFTVLAVNNTEFSQFLNEKFGVSTVGDITDDRLSELDDVMAYHIMEWSYAVENLTYGYSSSETPLDPLMIKKTSRYRNSIREEIIPEEIEGEYVFRTKNVVSEPKMLTFYSQAYIDEVGISDSDIQGFFPGVDMNFNTGDVLVSGAKIVGGNMPALNGWVHQISKVIEPQPNLREVIESDPNYSLFDQIAKPFARARFNSHYSEIFGTSTVEEAVDSLVTMEWFNLDTEYIGNNADYPNSQSRQINTQKLSATAFIPNNITLESFLHNQFDEFYTNVPGDVEELSLRKLVESCVFEEETVWPSLMKSGEIRDAYSIPFSYEEAQIEKKTAVSNGLFYGVNDFRTPEEFRCLTRLPLVNPKYKMFLHALEKVGYFSLLVTDPSTVEYTVFLVSDEVFNTVENITFENDVFLDQEGEEIKTSELRNILAQHIIDEKLDIKSDWEKNKFYKTIANTYVSIDKTGIRGAGNIDAYAELDLENGKSEEYNGIAYDVTSLIYPTDTYLGEIISSSSQYSEFYNLLNQAGLVQQGRIVILTGTMSTCFIPTNTAITKAITDGIVPTDTEELKNWLAKYFISEPVFSDGQNQGKYFTLRYNPDLSTPYSKVYESIDITVDDNGVITATDANNKSIITEVGQGDMMARNGIIHLVSEIYK